MPFTRHQLLRLLGWRSDGKSYARLEASLNRWTGVTLYYRNAWWNLARKCWVDEKFHVLDNVWLYHRDAADPPDTGLGTEGAAEFGVCVERSPVPKFSSGKPQEPGL